MSAIAEAATQRQVDAPAGGLAQLRNVPWTALLRWGSLSAAALALAVGAIRGEPQAIATAALGLLVSLVVVKLAFRGETREFALTLLLVAFGARVVLAVALHLLLIAMGREGNLLLDDRAYDKLGWTLARVWMGIFPGIRDTDEYLMVNWTYIVAAVYFTLGKSLLAAKMLMVAFGALLALATYALGREIFDERAGRIAGLLAAFFPSLMVWSATTLKDVMTVLVSVVAIYGLLRFGRRHDWWALLLCLGGFLAVENLRQFVFFILAWMLPVSFLFADRSEGEQHWRRLVLSAVLGILLALPLGATLWSSRELHDYLVFLPLALLAPAYLLLSRIPGGRKKLLLLTPLVLATMTFGFLTSNEKLGVNFLTPKALSAAEWKRWLEEQKAQSGFGEFDEKPTFKVDDFTIVSRNAAALPRNLLLVLFGPTPLDARTSTMAKAVLPEMLAWYVVLASAVVGLVAHFRRSWRDLVLPLGFSAIWVATLALTEGNLGNTFRHRSQFMPFVFVVAAAGLPLISSWLRAWLPGGAARKLAPAASGLER